MGQLLIIGASHGIGRAILDQQIDQRACTVINRTPTDLSHPHLTEYNLDVLSDELPEIDEIDGIIYCPGSINLKPISSIKEELLRQDFEINVVGAYRVIRHYLRALKKGNNPSITLFSTVAVDLGMAFHTSVAAAKGAVEGMMRSLAAELAPTIRVNAIAPTITDTPLAASLLRNDKMIEKMKERHPLKRIVQPEQIAAVVDLLIGENGSAITGQVFTIDSGISGVKV